MDRIADTPTEPPHSDLKLKAHIALGAELLPDGRTDQLLQVLIIVLSGVVHRITILQNRQPTLGLVRMRLAGRYSRGGKALPWRGMMRIKERVGYGDLE